MIDIAGERVMIDAVVTEGSRDRWENAGQVHDTTLTDGYGIAEKQTGDDESKRPFDLPSPTQGRRDAEELRIQFGAQMSSPGFRCSGWPPTVSEIPKIKILTSQK